MKWTRTEARERTDGDEGGTIIIIMYNEAYTKKRKKGIIYGIVDMMIILI
jgi:hypothetical protein